MKVLIIGLLVVLMIGCASVTHFDYRNVTYQDVQKEVLGYGFSKSMNESMAQSMAETTARKNIAEQLAGMQFVYTNLEKEHEIKLSIRNTQFSNVQVDQTVIIEKTGVLILIVKGEQTIRKPVGEGVLNTEMKIQFTDDLLKISRSRSNVLRDFIASRFPKAHEVKGFILIDSVDVGWNIDTGVIQYYEKYAVVVESVM